ncbi:shikimate dehydrogenase [Chelativorans sp.]|uniref:shikimate dehydrogenase family protein n=1 Tax=Chelativorans sp. TaxID=2203393 RepID=UPI0028113752|nr:shikimate dehydrogenase [Chelativorans sp.]
MLERYSGATRVYFILGHPIAQVKAPAGMTRFFEEHGRDAICVPIDVPPADFEAFVAAAAALLNVDGFAITIPHKFAAARVCATMSERTRLLTSCNIMRRNRDGTWHGDMLDGVGSVGAMRANGCTIEGKRALLVGAGGAGSAIGLALLDAGASELAVHDADPARRDALIARLRERHGEKVVTGSADPKGFAVVANATPAGMASSDSLPLDVERLDAGAFVSDVITVPEVTPLLQAARERGCGTSTGVEMFLAARRSMYDFWFEGA